MDKYSAKQERILGKVLHPDNYKLIKYINSFVGMVIEASSYKQLFPGMTWQYDLYAKPYVVLPGKDFKLNEEIYKITMDRRSEFKLLTDEYFSPVEIRYYPRSKRLILVGIQSYCKGESDTVKRHYSKILLNNLTIHEYSNYDELLISGISSTPGLVEYYKTTDFNDLDRIFHLFENPITVTAIYRMGFRITNLSNYTK